MKEKIRKKKFNKSDTETNKVKLILKRKGWFVTEGKNEACTAQQAIPGSAEVCRKIVLQFIMDCTLIRANAMHLYKTRKSHPGMY